MSEVVIRVENLYKEYRLGTISHGTLHRDLQSWWANLQGKEDPNSLVSSSYSDRATDTNKRFYALKDISFDVKQGEILGIIGRNGAGKSTLLKIMSKVTAPTRGTIKVKGRIASLLEVGTGFHPELTGRENIYLNGTILGMKRKEIDTKYEEIVDFAEIEEFVDTPVKRYSSGMYVRLAFAVAAHLEPEILLVDEVLAVGDTGFQKKCLGKMSEVSSEGRTVLFVSHNMQAVRALCPRSLLLDDGFIIADAPTHDTLLEYYNHLKQRDINANSDVMNPKNRRGSGAARITGIRIEDESGIECSRFTMGSTVRFVLSFQVYAPVNGLFIGILLSSGISRETVTSVRYKISEKKVNPGYSDSVIIEFPNVNLRPAEYNLYFMLVNGINRSLDVIDNLTVPLVIYTNKNFEDIGFNPSQPAGFFNIESRRV